jgi:hypothetical protein
MITGYILLQNNLQNTFPNLTLMWWGTIQRPELLQISFLPSLSTTAQGELWPPEQSASILLYSENVYRFRLLKRRSCIIITKKKKQNTAQRKISVIPVIQSSLYFRRGSTATHSATWYN